MAAKRTVQIGPFAKGMNNFSDPSALPDDAAADILNMELDLDGSLVSRPPFTATTVVMGGGSPVTPKLLGYYYAANGDEYLIASDRVTNTYYSINGGPWVLITATFAATAITQFDNKAWLLAPVGSANPGGTWRPTAGFIAEANMPKGTTIVAFKFRLWIAQGDQATANGSRMYFSKVLGVTPFWPVVPEFIDIAKGDGQSIIAIRTYYDSLLIFRTESIYRFMYTSDPAAGVIEVSVPGVGLESTSALATNENYFYFMHDDRAYEYMNGRASELSQALVFKSGSKTGFVEPKSVSIFNGRAIFSYYENQYVFSLKTRTWSRWHSSAAGGLAAIHQRRGGLSESFVGYVASSKSGDGKLYRIIDSITTDSEDFTCSVATKIFNYDSSSIYKRLYWWGVDAIYRQQVRGVVVPITYGGQVTWGELLTKTWGELLMGTWAQPTSKGLSVETIRPDVGASAQRKFTKFLKQLRFRQVQFRVEFLTDGSSSTAPVRLFSIHTEVTAAQGVSKAIT